MVNQKKILFVNNSLGMGGVETMIVDMIRLIPTITFSPEVAVFEGGGSLERVLGERDIPVHNLNKKIGVDLGLVLRLRQLIQRRKISVLHSHNFSAWLYSASAARTIGGIHHIHTEHSEVERSRRRYFAERGLSKITNHVIAVSSHVHEVMVQEIGISPTRAKLIHNGVNTTRFAPSATLRTQIRASLGLTESDYVVGIVARLAPIKNHALLLRAFASFELAAPLKKKLLIVGDGVERKALENLSLQLGLDGSVIFLGERHDTDVLFNAMDTYALSSFNEGMNLTLLEAMSSGLPAVATAVGGNTEIVEHERSGYLVAADNHMEMGLRLAQLGAAPQLRMQFGAAGRASTLRRFNENLMMDQYLSLYSEKSK
jgi:sugar transferase (PEP-CTERM/EpsH1 system associated)